MPRLTSLVAGTTHVLGGAHPNPRGYLLPEASWGLTRNPPRGKPFLYLVFFLLIVFFFFASLFFLSFSKFIIFFACSHTYPEPILWLASA